MKCVCMLAVAAIGACTIGDDDAEAVARALGQAWSKHHSMVARETIVHQFGGEHGGLASRFEGTYEVVRKGDRTLIRSDIESKHTIKVGGRELKLRERILTVSDGENQYVLVESRAGKHATKVKADPSDPVAPRGRIKRAQSRFNIQLLPDESFDGLEVHVLELTPKEPDQDKEVKTLWYFSQQHGVLLKEVAYVDGKPFRTTTYTDVEFDVAIGPQRFVFKPPLGVKVVDKTKEKP